MKNAAAKLLLLKTQNCLQQGQEAGHPTTMRQISTCDKTKCIFCQPRPGKPDTTENQNEKLYNCHTTAMGKDIQECSEKYNSYWIIQTGSDYSSAYPLSWYVMYYNICRTSIFVKT